MFPQIVPVEAMKIVYLKGLQCEVFYYNPEISITLHELAIYLMPAFATYTHQITK